MDCPLPEQEDHWTDRPVPLSVAALLLAGLCIAFSLLIYSIGDAARRPHGEAFIDRDQVPYGFDQNGLPKAPPTWSRHGTDVAVTEKGDQ